MAAVAPPLDDQFDEAAVAWTKTTGVPGVYRFAAGGSVELYVTIEKAVETIDDQGLVSRDNMGSLAKKDIAKPVEGDQIEAYGNLWSLTGLAVSDDHTHVVYLRDEGAL